jgi:hypothetical protein
MEIVYILETDSLLDRTEFTDEQEALIASYHYPDFEVKVYTRENNILKQLNYYFKGGVKKIF